MGGIESECQKSKDDRPIEHVCVMFRLQFCAVLDDVIDDASHGWNSHLEDHVHWCVWSAPIAIQVAFRLNLLAEWLMYWDMNREAELALRKALFCGVKVPSPFPSSRNDWRLSQLRGLKDRNSIRTLVSLSGAVWKQKRLEEALVLLKSAGEAFSAIDHEGPCPDAEAIPITLADHF